ncbi:hypothetical protein [Microvirgula aerodenitrificans]|uniref:hypothetical protein n=1 Tax=Microvirgula aerodenitrificans TaxID=57480 RepID=UPI00131EED9B|nr:hypothetical protein [Microvirgula aerodenitrificans]
MSKIKIYDDAPSGVSLHAHLEVVVDYLLANGNSLAHAYRWGSNRDGYFCHVSNPINFDELIAVFEFPPTIILGKEQNVIYCQKTGCLIQTIKNVV